MMTIDIQRKLTGASENFELNLQLNIKQGEFVSLYGPTGSGKSSALRMLAGLMIPDRGSVVVDGNVLFHHNKKINIKPQQRNIGMVFQDYSLFPNMTVRGNIEFALGEGQSKNSVDELIEMTELNNLQHQKPTMLSGGQKQRVALVRALVRKPKILLLDEPLSTLDSQMRLKLQDFILMFHKRFDLTTILVSHDLPEIIRMTKRVLVLENGSIQRDCDPKLLL